MHDCVRERLEDHLSGVPLPEVEAHLRTCEGCRKEVNAMQDQAPLFRTLKAPPDAGPGPAFYARVMNRIEVQARPSVWNLFGDSMFARRLMYASATLLVLFSSYLMSAGPAQDDYLAAGAPEAILAGYTLPEPVSMDKQRDREVVLVNLATWGGDSELASVSASEQDYQ